METAYRIRELAEEIGISKVYAVGNRVRNEEEKQFIQKLLPDFEVLGFLPYDEKVIEADQKNLLLWEHVRTFTRTLKLEKKALIFV
jgi:CO dehydrogenase maturation factor